MVIYALQAGANVFVSNRLLRGSFACCWFYLTFLQPACCFWGAFLSNVGLRLCFKLSFTCWFLRKTMLFEISAELPNVPIFVRFRLGWRRRGRRIWRSKWREHFWRNWRMYASPCAFSTKCCQYHVFKIYLSHTPDVKILCSEYFENLCVLFQRFLVFQKKPIWI